MKRGLFLASLWLALCGAPWHAYAVSAVFNGDPIDPRTGLPYEILPGSPLVQPGPDGVFGTADDVVDTSVVGDIDLVVRSGTPAAATAIPPPALQGGRAALPVGVAGSAAGGGSEVPFTVFLSDGITSPGAPSGQLLAASDMDGIPVVVAAFADLDGDGFIGPTNLDSAGAKDNHLEIRELDPVGRAVALFSGGVARGSVAIRTGLAASKGGLTVALAAMALTGPFDPSFFGGNIPSGPAISSALPFFPQRDLARLIRDRAVPAGPNTTLQQVIQFAALPSADAAVPFALPLDGSSPTIDGAVIHSQPAVRAVLREDIAGTNLRQPVDELTLGTRRPANLHRLRLVPVDRWENPADPPPAFAVRVSATPPLEVLRPPGGKNALLRSTAGARVVLEVPRGSADRSTGVLTIEHDGVVIGTLTYRVDARLDRPRVDLTVPSRQAPTIQAAIDQVADRNHDGALVVGIRSGLYHENVVVDRPVALHGQDADTTIIQGDGSTDTVALTAPNAAVHGLTAVGGKTGFALAGSSALLTDSRAWRNLGAGVSVAGADVQVVRTAALVNDGDGINVGAVSGAVCSANALIGNGGAGASLSGAHGAQLEDNRIAGNATGGISLTAVTGTTVSGNQCVDNLLSGIQLLASLQSEILGNLCATNDDDGLHVDANNGGGNEPSSGAQQPRRTDPNTDNTISGNTLNANHGYGLFVRRSPGDDFAAAAGLQPPPGDNEARGNRKGDVFVRTN